MRRLRLDDGVEIAYSVSGAGEPVILLHCWACSSTFWREQIPTLAETHQVIAADFRGHGASSAPDAGYSLEQLAHDIHTLIEHLGFGRAVVVGHSMGGMVAQQLAISHPADVKGLVLVATTSADPNGTMISAAIADLAKTDGYPIAFERNFDRWFVDASLSRVKNWIKAEMIRTPEEVALGLVRDYRNLDLRSQLGGIDVPTLVIAAEGDTSTEVSASEVIARLITGAKLTVIAGSGHFVQLERPHEVTAAIVGFLAGSGL